ncbi:TonB-dependent receptor [Algibacillus agarilyticus]|uniref:TonB-dependent receptor n=1 Tax=Algibacillus agarilyticus TaxID=2234133 RepID=UPI000DCF7B76|nr:TonB-dependent receptor [Algibacillus agarilyticus]
MPNQQTTNKTLKLKRTLLTVAVATALTSNIVHAAEAEADDEDMEVIAVTSQFKKNLESAINDKRLSPTISDSISADDIGSLPALDMGEALQAVPGVQLNREGGRRESSINLRGLPSSFVLTTANGQSIATPTRNGSGSATGSGNPFGAYNPAVFSGIKVVKALSAEMQEGGISGTVDQGLRSALDRKETLKVQIGGRYEGLADSVNPEFVVSGSKHLIEDVLAVNGTLAYSEQTFRQDLIKINAYDTMSSTQYANGNGAGTFDDWKTANGLATDSIIKMPGEYRQQSETNTGDRLSFSGGIEYKPTDALTLGFNTIVTKRELDGSRLEQLEMRLDKRHVGITPMDEYAPRLTDTKGTSGENIYVLSGVEFNDASYYFDNRQDAQLQESTALLFDAEWLVDQWTFDGAITISDATNQRNEVLLSSRLDNENISGGDRRLTGINGSVYTGEGEIGDFFYKLENANGAMDFDNAVWSVKNNVANTAKLDSRVNGDKNVYMIITGNYERVEHENNSIQFNAKRDFDDGFLTSVKFGYRYNEVSQDSDYAKGSSVGVDPTGILTSSVISDPSYTSEEEFFGGKAPGFVTAAAGWRAFDFNSVNQMLVNSIDITNVGASSAGEEPVLTPMGYIKRGGRQADGYVFSSSLDSHALYAMANFQQEIGSTLLNGNFGGRYVKTETESRAPLAGTGDINNLPEGVFPDEYSHFLPSANVSLNLDEEESVMLRFAYNKSLVRPDLRAASPTSQFKYIPGLAEVQLPGVGIKPFEADSFDLSLEWYNREGSAVTLALFNKEIENLFKTASLCDSSALVGTGVNLGKLTELSDGSCVTDGNDSLEDPDLLIDGSEVRMAGIVNIPDTISVKGLELSVQQNLDFLPYPFNGLGGVLNYSRTQQNDTDESRIPGISDETYNAIAYYEQDDYGIRIAYNYRTAYDLRTTGTSNGSADRSVKAAGRLDASVYYNFTDDLSFSLKAYNLTDNLYEEYQDNEWQPRTTKFSGKVFAASIKYTFM